VILLGNRDNNRTRIGKHRPKQRSGDIRLLGARTGIESAHVLRGWFTAGISVIPNVKLH
jgi:hypothetical protein